MRKTYRIIVASYVLVKAENASNARREFEADQELLEKSTTIGEDLLLNAEVVTVTEENED